MNVAKKFLPLLCFAALIATATPSKAQDGQKEAEKKTTTFVAAGSGVNLGITNLLAQFFMAEHPNIVIKVPGSIGSKGGITAVKDGAITLGLTSRPLKPEEKAAGIKEVPYAKTPIVIGVHQDVEEDEISSQELIDIYKGSKTKWKNGSDIVVHVREAYDSGFMILEKNVAGFKEVADESRKADRWITKFTDQDSNEAIARTKNSIGVTDLGMIKSEKLDIRPLRFNGIAPTVETMESGKYPLNRTLYLLYREQTLPEAARAFLDFIRSEQGAEILKIYGYQPL